MTDLTYCEFFAGGGMVTAALGPRWRRLLANDIDPAKAAAFRANWGDAGLVVGDVAALSAADVPGRPDLVWASSPCQDLSLGGRGAGLSGARSGAFRPFWRIVRGLAEDGRAARVVAFENVYGALVSSGGRDLAEIARAFADAGYLVGAAVLDAADFVPQSRPRLFMLGFHADTPPPAAVVAEAPDPARHPAALQAGLAQAVAQGRAFHLAPPRPPRRNHGLVDLLDQGADGWFDPAATAARLALMAPRHRAALEAARAAPGPVVGAAFRRTRIEDGRRVSRYEARWDGLAGCLRTPAGGSSRQEVIVVAGGATRIRLLNPRESARLMGLPEHYVLPARTSAALRITGDGVAAPVVRWLAETVLEPALQGAAARAAAE